MEVVDAFKDAFDSLVTLTKLAASLPSALKNMDFGDVRKIWAERKAFEAEMGESAQRTLGGSLTPHTDSLLKISRPPTRAERTRRHRRRKRASKGYVSRNADAAAGQQVRPVRRQPEQPRGRGR